MVYCDFTLVTRQDHLLIRCRLWFRTLKSSLITTYLPLSCLVHHHQQQQQQPPATCYCHEQGKPRGGGRSAPSKCGKRYARFLVTVSAWLTSKQKTPDIVAQERDFLGRVVHHCHHYIKHNFQTSVHHCLYHPIYHHHLSPSFFIPNRQMLQAPMSSLSPLSLQPSLNYPSSQCTNDQWRTCVSSNSTPNMALPFSLSNSVILCAQPSSWFNYYENRQFSYSQNEPDGHFDGYQNKEPEDYHDYSCSEHHPRNLTIRPGSFHAPNFDAPSNCFSQPPHNFLSMSEQQLSPGHTFISVAAAAPPLQQDSGEVEYRLNEVMYEVHLCWWGQIYNSWKLIIIYRK